MIMAGIDHDNDKVFGALVGGNQDVLIRGICLDAHVARTDESGKLACEIVEYWFEYTSA